MTPLSDELEALRQEYRAGIWVPSPGEDAAAQSLASLSDLTALGIRDALGPARTTRSRLVITYEKVASVLSLPAIHGAPDTLDQLVATAADVAKEIATASIPPSGN
ncbi:hypothetical protein ACFWXO_36790 [Kitasatospora sp. NPDC059088]|uniref:hypothetical protein n=1 Tax=Kitasatospora sp. NPDC059088 TaxID=3346722 RepID=UPI00368A6EED